MPLFQIGYRRYEGERTSHGMRWLPITRSGVAIAWRSKLLRRVVYASYLPFIYFGWVFFMIGKITDPNTDPDSPVYLMARAMLGDELFLQLHRDPSTVRTAIWSIVFAVFSSSFQLILTGLMAAIVGPPLVSNDLRSRSFLVYFARPVSRVDYVLGKVGVLVVLLGAVTLAPNLALYLLSILFSPSLDTVVQTAPVAVSVALASLGTIVPVALVVLTLSSLTRQARFATAAWFAICLFGLSAYTALSNTRGLRDSAWTFLASPFHTLRTLQLGLYDVAGRTDQVAFQRDLSQLANDLTTSDSPTMAAAWLLVVCAACVAILLRRVDAPTRI